MKKQPDAHNRSRYVNHGCRCPVCRKANREYELHNRTNGPGPKRTELKNGRHDRSRYINWGCRCDTCRQASIDYMVEYRKKRRAERVA